MFQDRNPKYFLTVAAERSISKAAERLHISLPYLSQYIIRLEKEFNVPLLDRKKLPLELTAAGEVYLRYLEECSLRSEDLFQNFDRLSAGRKQTLCIAMSNWRASTLLPNILPHFSREHPEVHLELFEQPTSELYRLVADSKADFAIMNTDLDTPDYLVTETLLYEKILLVGNRANPTARALYQTITGGGQPDLSLLEHERMILLRPELMLAARVNNYLERKRIIPQSFIYSSNATTALNLTAGNYGFCFVNETAIYNAPNREALIFYDLNSPDLSHPLSVVYKKKRYLLPAARDFIDMVSRFSRSHEWRAGCDCCVGDESKPLPAIAPDK